MCVIALPTVPATRSFPRLSSDLILSGSETYRGSYSVKSSVFSMVSGVLHGPQLYFLLPSFVHQRPSQLTAGPVTCSGCCASCEGLFQVPLVYLCMSFKALLDDAAAAKPSPVFPAHGIPATSVFLGHPAPCSCSPCYFHLCIVGLCGSFSPPCWRGQRAQAPLMLVVRHLTLPVRPTRVALPLRS